MRVKIPVTLPEAVWKDIDLYARDRSTFLEPAVGLLLVHCTRQERGRKDAAILTKNADRLNREATAGLEYQGFFE